MAPEGRNSAVAARRLSALLIAPMTVLAFSAPVSIPSSLASDTAPARATAPSGGDLPSSDPDAPTNATLAARTAPASFADATATPDVPAKALVAYHRAEAVINASSQTCHLPWQMLAAVGQVESDHGRRTPPPATPLADTDAGLHDGNADHDLPMGPLQLTPQVWAKVAIDADGDGTRDANDLDDAALGLAVLLCSTGESLGTPEGQRLALALHNANRDYVDAVITLAEDYAKPSVVSAQMIPPVLVGPATSEPPKVRARKASRAEEVLGAEGGAAIIPAPAQKPRPTEKPKPVDETNDIPGATPSGQAPTDGAPHVPGPAEESPETPPEPALEPTPERDPGADPEPGSEPGDQNDATCAREAEADVADETLEGEPTEPTEPAEEQPADGEAPCTDDATEAVIPGREGPDRPAGQTSQAPAAGRA